MKKLAALLCVFVFLAGCSQGSGKDSGVLDEKKEVASSSTSAKSEIVSEDLALDDLTQDESESEKTGTDYEVTYSKVTTFKSSIGTVWATIIFEVENTGSETLVMGSGTADLEDANGKLVSNQTMISAYPQVIEPGEKAYYFDQTTLENLQEAIELTAIVRPDAKKASVAKLQLPVSDVEISDSRLGGPKALGRVENTTTEDCESTYVAIVLFDAEDKPCAVLFTIISDLISPGEKVGFEANAMSLPKDLTAESVSRFEAFAYPHQFDFS